MTVDPTCSATSRLTASKHRDARWRSAPNTIPTRTCRRILDVLLTARSAKETFHTDYPLEPDTLAYANAGPNTNGSQYFITEVTTDWLDGTFTLLGRCEPMAVIEMLTAVPTDGEPPMGSDRPLMDACNASTSRAALPEWPDRLCAITCQECERSASRARIRDARRQHPDT